MFFSRNSVLRVDIPALDSLLAYLRERDTTQQQVDAAVALIAVQTKALAEFRVRLAAAVAKQQ